MNQYKIQFTEEVASEIATHLESSYPNEGCGFFFGKNGSPRFVTKTIKVKNVKKGDQRRRFEIDPVDYINAERFALENGLDFLGIYHSHPDHPAIPSGHDRKQAMPFFSYLIISVQEGKSENATSWRLDDETRRFEEEELINQYYFIKTIKNV